MTLSKIWVLAEASDGKVATTTLEILTKVRELAGTVEAIYAGGDADAVAAGVVVIAAVGEGVCGGGGVMLGVDASGTMHDWMTTEPAAPAPLTGAPPT